MVSVISNESILQLTKGEICEFIAMLPSTKMLKTPLEKYPKLFKKYKYLDGFRPQRQPLDRIQKLYSEGILDSNGQDHFILLHQFSNQIRDYVGKIEKKLKRNDIDFEEMLERIKSDKDTESLKVILDSLIENDLNSAKSVRLLFKILNVELSEEQLLLIDQNYSYMYERKVSERRVKKELELEYKGFIKEKDETIRSLNKEVKHLSIELDSKIKEIQEFEIRIAQLQNENAKKVKELLEKKEKEFNMERDQWNKEKILLENQLMATEKEMHELKELLNDKYNAFAETAAAKWEEEYHALITERKNIENSISFLKENKMVIIQEIEKLTKEMESKQKQIAEMEKYYHVIVHEMMEHVDKVQEVLRILVGSGKESVNSSSDQSNVFIRLPESNQKTDIVISKADDFLDYLADNFESRYIHSNHSYLLAKYIYAALKHHIPLLLIGSGSREIANCIAALIEGKDAAILSLPAGFNQVNNLIHMIQSLQSTVILVEHALDGINENVYMTCIKTVKDKFLLFSLDSIEHVKILPDSVFGHLLPINVDSVLSVRSKDIFTYAITEHDVFDIFYQPSELEQYYRSLKNLPTITQITNAARIQWSKLIADFNHDEPNPDIYYCLFRYTLSMVCQPDQIDQWKRFLQNQDVSGDLLKDAMHLLESD